MSLELSMEVDVDCNKCGSTLEAVFNVSHNTIEVGPCECCLDAARDEVRDEMNDEILDLEEKADKKIADLEEEIIDLKEELTKSE